MEKFYVNVYVKIVLIDVLMCVVLQILFVMIGVVEEIDMRNLDVMKIVLVKKLFVLIGVR